MNRGSQDLHILLLIMGYPCQFFAFLHFCDYKAAAAAAVLEIWSVILHFGTILQDGRTITSTIEQFGISSEDC